MNKVTWCLHRNPGISFTDFETWVADQLASAIVAMPIKSSITRFMIAFTNAWQNMGVPKRKYDAILDFWFAADDSTAAFLSNKDIHDFLSVKGKPFLSFRQCCCLVTRELPAVFDMDTSTKMGQKPKCRFTTLLVRNQNMSFDAFTSHHKEKHIQLFSSVPIIQKKVERYIISHSIMPQLVNSTVFQYRYDGIVEFWFDSGWDMFQVFFNPKYLGTVRPDEHRFLELNKCDFIISYELPPIIA